MPISAAARVEKPIGVPRLTAHTAIDALVEGTGRERRRIFEAPRIFEAVYGSVGVESRWSMTDADPETFRNLGSARGDEHKDGLTSMHSAAACPVSLSRRISR